VSSVENPFEEHTLETRRYHDMESRVLFVDLIKAFDTVNHELFFKLFEQCGAPPIELADVVRRMYTDMQVKLTIGSVERLINYTIGVQQGDNMAPVLFLFFMQAYSGTLEQKWESEWGLTNPKFRFMNSSSDKGQLLAQDIKEEGSAFNLNHILNVDDGTFVFESRHKLNQGAVKLSDHFAVFGLKMHIGRDGKKSKTEAMFFPRRNTQEHEYDLTATIPVKDGYISFVPEAKYLGAIVTQDLKDEREVSKCIEKGWQLIGMLRRFFNDRDVCIPSKARIYDAFITNAVLWGCEVVVRCIYTFL
jgi:hypothetical protein